MRPPASTGGDAVQLVDRPLRSTNLQEPTSILAPHECLERRVFTHGLEVGRLVDVDPEYRALGQRLPQEVDGTLPLAEDRRQPGAPECAISGLARIGVLLQDSRGFSRARGIAPAGRAERRGSRCSPAVLDFQRASLVNSRSASSQRPARYSARPSAARFAAAATLSANLSRHQSTARPAYSSDACRWP